MKKVKDFNKENIGKWECSGGKLVGNEDPKKTLLREIKEETGLKVKIVRQLPSWYGENRDYESFCYVYLLKADSDKVKLSDEHSAYVWKTSVQIKNMPLVMFAKLLNKYFEWIEKGTI